MLYRVARFTLLATLLLVGLSLFTWAMTLMSHPGTEQAGLLNKLLAPLTTNRLQGTVPTTQPSLLLKQALAELPTVDNYRWNKLASESSVLAAFWWWLVLTIVGMAAWPLAFYVFRPLRDRGYLFSRTLGWIIAGWLLWWLASMEWAVNSVVNAWLAFLVLVLAGITAGLGERQAIRMFLRRNWTIIAIGEVLFAVSYGFFVIVRLLNPDLWQPWFGGEKFMEFAFLNGILRSPFFPPVDPHYAGGYINYYYFGFYLVAFLIKLTGIYAEVAFNLAIPTLFALTVTNSFGLAYSAIGIWIQRQHCNGPVVHTQSTAVPLDIGNAVEQQPAWRVGLAGALLAPLFVALIGNLAGLAQLAKNLAQVGQTTLQSAFSFIPTTLAALNGLMNVATHQQVLPRYDFWAPSRVIPDTINEFPYWSFLFADLHPHVIAMPVALLCLGLIFTFVSQFGIHWRHHWRYSLALLACFAFVLGVLASNNLWELPTYAGLALLALAVYQVRCYGRLWLGVTVAVGVAYLVGAYLLFLPFFQHYAPIGAGGIGVVAQGDPLDLWLNIWGFFLFILMGWLIFVASQPLHRDRSLLSKLQSSTGLKPGKDAPLAGERRISQSLRNYEQLPRLIYLQRRLVKSPSLGYHLTPITVLGSWLLASIAWLLGWYVVALCLLPLGVLLVLLWRQSQQADSATLMVTVLFVVGLAVLIGTQLFYLKDFLAGGPAYRMNTVFKFSIQVWVLWAIAAAVALYQVWNGWQAADEQTRASKAKVALRFAWQTLIVLLVVASLTYPVFGTPDRLQMRMIGWRPPLGSLNGLDYMRKGSFTLPQGDHRIDLAADWQAIQWLLENVQGNRVIAESYELDYYQKGGTRIASMTGLSGLNGMHEGEQRYGELVGQRDLMHRELWNTPDISRTQELLDELQVDYVYVGQLERYYHPEGMAKLERMAADNLLTPVFENDQVTIYATIRARP